MTRLERGADATDRLNMIEANSFQIWLTAAQNDAAQSMISTITASLNRQYRALASAVRLADATSAEVPISSTVRNGRYGT